MENDKTATPANSPISRHIEAIRDMKIAVQPPLIKARKKSAGLASLQKSTVSLMKSKSKNWGFTGTALNVKRQKLNDEVWKITVKDPKTREIILEAEGHGDKIFSHEDNLARMAEALMESGLKITTQFNK